jgi:hypothetical protein
MNRIFLVYWEGNYANGLQVIEARNKIEAKNLALSNPPNSYVHLIKIKKAMIKGKSRIIGQIDYAE